MLLISILKIFSKKYVYIKESNPCENLYVINFFILNRLLLIVEYTWQIIQSPLNPSKKDIIHIFIFSFISRIETSKQPLLISKRADKIVTIFFEKLSFKRIIVIILPSRLNIIINPNILLSVKKDFSIDFFTISKKVKELLDMTLFWLKDFDIDLVSCIIDMDLSLVTKNAIVNALI